jgi:hypothetical protein
VVKNARSKWVAAPLDELELVERSHRLDAGVADQNVDAPKSSTASIRVSLVKSTAMPIALSTSPSSAAAAAAPA